jgi:hypothetical protein
VPNSSQQLADVQKVSTPLIITAPSFGYRIWPIHNTLSLGLNSAQKVGV